MAFFYISIKSFWISLCHSYIGGTHNGITAIVSLPEELLLSPWCLCLCLCLCRCSDWMFWLKCLKTHISLTYEGILLILALWLDIGEILLVLALWLDSGPRDSFDTCTVVRYWSKGFF